MSGFVCNICTYKLKHDIWRIFLLFRFLLNSFNFQKHQLRALLSLYLFCFPVWNGTKFNTLYFTMTWCVCVYFAHLIEITVMYHPAAIVGTYASTENNIAIQSFCPFFFLLILSFHCKIQFCAQLLQATVIPLNMLLVERYRFCCVFLFSSLYILFFLYCSIKLMTNN